MTVSTFIEEPAQTLTSKHLEELDNSAINREISTLNWKSVEGNNSYEYVLYSPNLKRTNTGRLSQGTLNYHRNLESGGLYVSGINIFTGEDSLWGSFKPNEPRRDSEGKLIKYLHPPKERTEAFFLRVPHEIWKLVASNFNAPLPEGYENLSYLDFWLWVKEMNLPLCICEGAKKAGSLLSLGLPAIALPGVWNGCRRLDPESYHRELIPELKFFATEGRVIYFCFDQDSKRSTIRQVNRALSTTAKLFQFKKCVVKVSEWLPCFGKGIDDVIANMGAEFLGDIIKNSLNFAQWQTRNLKRLTHLPDLEIDSRYLGEEISVPHTKQLIWIKSDKGTGKTELFSKWVKPILFTGTNKILIITHRVQLGVNLCNRLGVPFIKEVRENSELGIQGLGLCIDSLHPKSQARFNYQDWKGAWVFLDELQQLIWHVLSSTTCRKERVAILKTFKSLLLYVIQTGGKIFTADADLDDTGIDFIKGIVGEDVDTFGIINTHKPATGRKVYHFTDKNPARITQELLKQVRAGKKVLLNVSGQKAKSKHGSRVLERYANSELNNPEVQEAIEAHVEQEEIEQEKANIRYSKENEKLIAKKAPGIRILRIDSETVSDPTHPAFCATERINEIIQNYDLVITTPTIETGVSIDVVHFDAVFGIFQGVQTTNSVRQHLSRYRPSVPIYLWCRPIGLGKIGTGDTSYVALLKNEERKDAVLRRNFASLAEEMPDGKIESIYFVAWAWIGSVINSESRNYRSQIVEDLALEGYEIINYLKKEDEPEANNKGIEAARDLEYAEYVDSIVSAIDVDDDTYLKLDKKQSKTAEERSQYEKGRLKRQFRVDITDDLVRNSQKPGWTLDIRRDYYFRYRKELLEAKEVQDIKRIIDAHQNYFLVDTNQSSLIREIKFLECGKLDQLLNCEEIYEDHPLSIEIGKKLKPMIKSLKTVGIDLTDKTNKYTNLFFCRKVLEKIGYTLPKLVQRRVKENRIWIYGKPAAAFKTEEDKKGKLKLVLSSDGKAIPLSDGREQIFEAWYQRDSMNEEYLSTQIAEALKTADSYDEVTKIIESWESKKQFSDNDVQTEEQFEINKKIDKAIQLAWSKLSLDESTRIHGLQMAGLETNQIINILDNEILKNSPGMSSDHLALIPARWEWRLSKALEYGQQVVDVIKSAMNTAIPSHISKPIESQPQSFQAVQAQEVARQLDTEEGHKNQKRLEKQQQATNPVEFAANLCKTAEDAKDEIKKLLVDQSQKLGEFLYCIGEVIQREILSPDKFFHPELCKMMKSEVDRYTNPEEYLITEVD